MTVDICTESVPTSPVGIQAYDPKHEAMENPMHAHAKMEGGVTADIGMIQEAVLHPPKAIRDLGVIN